MSTISLIIAILTSILMATILFGISIQSEKASIIVAITLFCLITICCIYIIIVGVLKII